MSPNKKQWSFFMSIFLFSGSVSYRIERFHVRSNFFVSHCYQCFIFGKSKTWNMCDVFFQVCHIFVILSHEVYALSLFSRNFITLKFCIINVESKIFCLAYYIFLTYITSLHVKLDHFYNTLSSNRHICLFITSCWNLKLSFN